MGIKELFSDAVNCIQRKCLQKGGMEFEQGFCIGNCTNFCLCEQMPFQREIMMKNRKNSLIFGLSFCAD